MSAKKKDVSSELASAPKLLDVAKPGKTAASATSRPIIVGHGSTMKQDPMVTAPEDELAEAEAAAPPPSRPHTGMVLKPIEHSQDSEAQQEAAAENNDSQEKPDDDPAAPETSDSAAVDALADAANEKKENKKEEDEAALRALEYEKIIESKQYFVPVGEAKRRRSNQRIFMVFVLLIIIAATGINFAADAGILNIGIDPLTDLL